MGNEKSKARYLAEKARRAAAQDAEREAFEATFLAIMGGNRAWIERADEAAQGDRLSYCEVWTRRAWLLWQQARAGVTPSQAPSEPHKPDPRTNPEHARLFPELYNWGADGVPVVGEWQRGCNDGKTGAGKPPGGGDFSPYANGYRWGEQQRNAGVPPSDGKTFSKKPPAGEERS